jgi:hypothetical protein
MERGGGGVRAEKYIRKGKNNIYIVTKKKRRLYTVIIMYTIC